jgi:hypothetical protein
MIYVISWDEISGEFSEQEFGSKVEFFHADMEESGWPVRKRWDIGTTTLTEYRSDRNHAGFSAADEDKEKAERWIRQMAGNEE